MRRIWFSLGSRSRSGSKSRERFCSKQEKCQTYCRLLLLRDRFERRGDLDRERVLRKTLNHFQVENRKKSENFNFCDLCLGNITFRYLTSKPASRPRLPPECVFILEQNTANSNCAQEIIWFFETGLWETRIAACVCVVFMFFFRLIHTDDDVIYHDGLLAHGHNEQIEHEFHVHRCRHRPFDRVHLRHLVF